MINGENSIIRQATNAKEEVEKANELEQVKLAVIGAKLENNELNTSELQKVLKTYNLNGTLRGSKNWVYIGNNNNYLITQNGEVSITEQQYLGIIIGNTENALPDGYQQVEYIESTGTQYIISDIEVQSGLKVESKSIVTEGGDMYIFGARNQYGSCFFNGFYGNKFQTNYNGYWLIGSQNLNTSYIIKTALEIGNQIVSVDGLNIYTGAKSDKIISDGTKCTIFCVNTNNTDNYYFYKGKAYYLKISKENDIIGYFLPVLDKDNVPCMYDIITKRTFYNKGSDEFLYGQKVDKKIFNCVGNKKSNDKYEIPITLKTSKGEKSLNISLDEPLRKIEDTSDYLDLINKKVVRYTKQDTITGDILLLDSPTEEYFEADNIDFNDVISIQVDTDIQPSSIE